MLRLRQRDGQLGLFDEFLAPELRELPDDLRIIDAWLDDPRFFEPFKDKYHARLGRPSIPAETYLRLTALKHQYNLSDRLLCEQVADRIRWRRFCRIPWDRPVPHPSSLSKIRHRLDAAGGDHMAELNRHLVQKAQEQGLLKARKLRSDTTVTEANLHYPTDASLIGDGVRAITRVVKQVKALGVAMTRHVRDRTRSVKKRLLQIGKTLRRRSGEAVQEVRRITGDLARIAQRTVRDARALAEALAASGEATRQRLATKLETLCERTARVIEQAKQVNAGQRQIPDRLVSIHDPDARPITRGKLGKRVEFGYKVRLTESDEGLVTEYAVFCGNPPDRELLPAGIEATTARLGRPPKAVALDRGGYNRTNERRLRDLGIQRVCIPVTGKRSPTRRQYERQSWFKRLQCWRAGQEGRISVLKRRYGLDRTRYRGYTGAKRWVGGVIWGANLRQIARLA